MLEVARAVLLFEGYTNCFLFGPIMILYPEVVLASFLQDQASSDIPDLARQCFAWFGGTTTTLAGYLLYKAMLMGGDTEKLLLRTMFIGDILYIGNFAYWVHYGLGYWTTGSMFNLIYGLLLPLCRAIVLYSEPFEESSREIDLDPDELLDNDKDK